MPNAYTGREAAYMREWYAANPHKAKEYRERAKINNPEMMRRARAKWDARNPGKKAEGRNKWRAKNWRRRKTVHYQEKFGVTLEFLEEVLCQQGGKCAICGTVLFFSEPRTSTACPHVDHCHATGKVRGILCRRCNQQLGNYEVWPEFSTYAMLYLKAANVV